MANDLPVMTLDAAISKLSAASDLDRRGEVAEACIVLRDTTGRSRKDALCSMCIASDVARRENIEGKWKERSLASLQTPLRNYVCLAAAQWQPQSPGQPEQRGDPDHTAPYPAKHDAHKHGELFQHRSPRNVSLQTQKKWRPNSRTARVANGNVAGASTE